MIKICLDAGHFDKINQSPAIKKYYESDMTWKLHLYLKEELEKLGIKVITSRSDQKLDKGLFERGTISKGCSLFISIHSNAVGSLKNDEVDYPLAITLLNGSSDDIGLKLAKTVQEVINTKQSARIWHRRGTYGEYYGVLRGANHVGTPALILEHSFHTNTKITKWLLDDDNLKKLAKAEAMTIAEHYNVTTEKVDADNEFKPYLVRVKIPNLNIRKGAGTNYDRTGAFTGVGVFTIVEEKDGRGASKWGKLKSGVGWISLDYASKL